jgi:hypothetical protein
LISGCIQNAITEHERHLPKRRSPNNVSASLAAGGANSGILRRLSGSTADNGEPWRYPIASFYLTPIDSMGAPSPIIVDDLGKDWPGPHFFSPTFHFHTDGW